MRDTRNYGKLHPRFIKGGAVPKSRAEVERALGERATREELKETEREFEESPLFGGEEEEKMTPEGWHSTEEDV